MNSTSTSRWVQAVALGMLVWGTTAATGCAAEIDADPAYYPPPAFVASAYPVYYEGRPAYWYNNRWYFRSGGGWGYYRNEPHYLYEHRGYVPARGYVRGGGRVVVHER